MILFQNQTSNATSIPFSPNDRIEVVVVQGIWDGASISLEAKTKNTDWQLLKTYSGDILTITDDTITNINQLKAKEFEIRAILTGAAGTTSITVEVI